MVQHISCTGIVVNRLRLSQRLSIHDRRNPHPRCAPLPIPSIVHFADSPRSASPMDESDHVAPDSDLMILV